MVDWLFWLGLTDPGAHLIGSGFLFSGNKLVEKTQPSPSRRYPETEKTKMAERLENYDV